MCVRHGYQPARRNHVKFTGSQCQQVVQEAVRHMDINSRVALFHFHMRSFPNLEKKMAGYGGNVGRPVASWLRATLSSLVLHTENSSRLGRLLIWTVWTCKLSSVVPMVASSLQGTELVVYLVKQVGLSTGSHARLQSQRCRHEQAKSSVRIESVMTNERRLVSAVSCQSVSRK